jgi:hypothetical protein
MLENPAEVLIELTGDFYYGAGEARFQTEALKGGRLGGCRSFFGNGGWRQRTRSERTVPRPRTENSSRRGGNI